MLAESAFTSTTSALIGSPAAAADGGVRHSDASSNSSTGTACSNSANATASAVSARCSRIGLMSRPLAG